MPALPEPLETVRKEAVDTLVARLNAMCDGADDALFDLSQKAPADEQSLYFDAMRELRLKRQDVTGDFRTAMDRLFESLAAGSGAAKAAARGALNADTLSLLGEDELDVSVAFQAMVGRARDIVATDIDHLRQRLDKVLSRELDVEKVPLHPQLVCEHFRAASESLSLPLKARLILYKLFERNLLDYLKDIIAQANQTLAHAGVLPEIKSAKPRPSPDTSRGSKSKKAVQDEGDDDSAARRGSEEIAGAFAELLALARSAMTGGGPGMGGMMGMLPGGVAGAGVAPGTVVPVSQLPAGQVPVMYNGQAMVGGMIVQSDVPLQVVPAAELTALLTRLQQMQPVAAEDTGRVFDHVEAVDVKGGLSELITVGDDAPRAINGVDDDVINLVSMLFSFILDDKDLSPEMKALIGRLQIPLLKVALIDRKFFGAEDHPARQLINSLARAGMGWTRETDDGLYRKVEETVFTVLNDFTDDVSLFGRLGREFAEFVAERDKRLQLVEARLRDREEGQAKADWARAQVRDVVASRLANRTLPREALGLVQNAWQRVLYMTALRDGIEGEVWQQRCKVLEVLVWCSQKYEKEDLRVRQRSLLPRLVVSVRKGFEATGFDPARGEEMLAALTRVVTALAGGEKARTVRVVAEVPPVAPAPAASAPEGRTVVAPATPVPAATEAVQVLRSTEDEVVIAASPPPPPPPPASDERWVHIAENLPPGSWIEFSEDDFKVRLKLAARIRVQNRLVFVNSRGVKIAEKTVEQLAADLQSGVARLVSDMALFDRALETMIGRLKNAQAAV